MVDWKSRRKPTCSTPTRPLFERFIMPVVYAFIGILAGIIAALVCFLQGAGLLWGLVLYSATGQIAILSVAVRQARDRRLRDH